MLAWACSLFKHGALTGGANMIEIFFLGFLMMLPMIAGGITFVLSVEATED